MTELRVSIGELKKYSNTLTDYSTEYNSIIKRMQEIIAALSENEGWVGPDADKFKSNAIAYLNGLKTVKSALDSSADKVSTKASQYVRRIETARAQLRG